MRVREKRDGERRKKRRERHVLSPSLANRRSKRVGVRDKVGLRDESYTWVPEIACFVALQKVGVSPCNTLKIS